MRLILVLGLVLLFVGWFARYGTEDPLRAAERAFRRGDYAQAAVLYAYAARVTEDPGHAVFNRAASLYCQSEFEAAAESYQSARDAENPARTARANYDLGNCALRDACQVSQGAVAPLLHQAIAHYQACLDQEGKPGVATPELMANARHNQELARKLLQSAAYRAQKSARSEAARSASTPQSNQGDKNRGRGQQQSPTASATKKDKPTPQADQCLH
jgi:hypothetical protein